MKTFLTIVKSITRVSDTSKISGSATWARVSWNAKKHQNENEHLHRHVTQPNPITNNASTFINVH